MEKKKKYLFILAHWHKDGFLLLESLIYIVLSTIFSLFLFQFAATSYKNYTQIYSISSQLSSISGAFDVIARDIQNGEGNNEWVIRNKKLIRISNLQRQHKKDSKIETIVANNITSIDFSLNKPQYLPISRKFNRSGIVTIILHSKVHNKEYKFSRTIAVNNRDISL